MVARCTIKLSLCTHATRLRISPLFHYYMEVISISIPFSVGVRNELELFRRSNAIFDSYLINIIILSEIVG